MSKFSKQHPQQEIARKKLYKSGKLWVTATIASVFLFAPMYQGQASANDQQANTSQSSQTGSDSSQKETQVTQTENKSQQSNTTATSTATAQSSQSQSQSQTKSTTTDQSSQSQNAQSTSQKSADADASALQNKMGDDSSDSQQVTDLQNQIKTLIQQARDLGLTVDDNNPVTKQVDTSTAVSDLTSYKTDLQKKIDDAQAQKTAYEQKLAQYNQDQENYQKALDQYNQDKADYPNKVKQVDADNAAKKAAYDEKVKERDEAIARVGDSRTATGTIDLNPLYGGFMQGKVDYRFTYHWDKDQKTFVVTNRYFVYHYEAPSRFGGGFWDGFYVGSPKGKLPADYYPGGTRSEQDYRLNTMNGDEVYNNIKDQVPDLGLLVTHGNLPSVNQTIIQPAAAGKTSDGLDYYESNTAYNAVQQSDGKFDIGHMISRKLIYTEDPEHDHWEQSEVIVDDPGVPVSPQEPDYEQYPAEPTAPTDNAVKPTAPDLSKISVQPVQYVNALKANVTYLDQNTGQTLHADDLTVPYQGTSTYKTADEIQTLEKQGYELVSDGFPAQGLAWHQDTNTASYQVVLKHKDKTVDPNNPGQPGQPIDPNNPDGPKYPNGTDKSALEKTITRTINYVDANGKEVASPKTETVTYDRTATIDQVTRKVTYSDWTPKDGQNSYSTIQSPVVNGYYADQNQVAGKTVGVNDQDETVKVTYQPMGHLVPDVPGNNPVIYPNNPADSTQPSNPVIPNIPGYTPTDGNGQPVKPGDQYPIDPKQPGKDTPIHYVKDLQAKVTYTDQSDGKTLHEDSLTVPYQGSSDYKTANQIASLEKQGYELVSDNFPADGLHYQKEGQQSEFQVVLKHKDKTVDPNTPGQPGQPIDPNNPDGPKYPDGTDKSSLEKTITRTIDYVDGNGKQVAPSKTETVTYDRTATIDQVTRKVTYSDWTAKDGQNSYSTVQSPVVNGYYADQNQVDGKTVGVNDQDETVKVTYQPMGHLVPDVPGQNPVIYPNNPADPTQPTNPVIPNIPGYTPTDGNGQPVKPGDQYPIDPKQPGKDTPIHYVKDLQAKVTYIDQNDGKTLHEDAVTVPYQGQSSYKTANQITALEKQGYELVSDNFPADGLHYQKEGQQSDYQVVLKHKDKTVDPNTPGQPGQPIDPNNPDGPKYPDGTDKSSLEKTVTRTINYVDANGKEVASPKTETVTYDRTATIDEVTGKVTYSDWTPKDGQNSYDTVKSPVVDGYYADRNQVDGKTVNPNDSDETVKVTYQPMGHLVPDVPGNNPVVYPNNPSDPTQPTNPVVPSIPGYTPTDGSGQPVKPGDQYPIDPKQPGKDTPIHYVKDLQAKVTYTDQNDGKTLHEDSLTVPYQGSSDYKTANQIASLEKQGYELVSDNFPTDGLHYQKEGQQSEFQVVLKHKDKTVDPNTPGQPGQPIDPNNPDGPKYPNGTDKSSLEKTITRTINYVDANGKEVASPKTETVTYDRTATVDEVTGKVTYSDWTAKDGQTSFAGTPSPVVPGYYADQAQVPGKTVSPDDQDETVKVTYQPMGHLVPDVPGQNPVIYPNNPTNPSQPGNPVVPNIPGYTPTDGNGQPVKPGDQYPIDPKQPGKDTPIHYVKDLQAKVTYIDQNDGKTLHEDSLTVPYQGSSDYKTTNQIASLEKQGYELVSDNFPADGLHYQKEGQQSDFQVVLKHKDKTVDPNTPGQPGQPIDPNNPDGPKYPNGTDKSSLEKTITRTINYVDANGKEVASPKTETVTYDRTATVDEVTGQVTYSDWTAKEGQNSYNTVQSPVVNGYYADQEQVDGKTVGVNDQDETVTVTYHAMGHLVPDVPGNNPVIYPNNPSDPTQPTNPVVPSIPGYTPTDGSGQPVKPGDQYPIDPKQPGKDTPIHYVKDLQAKVTYIDQNDGKTLHEDSLTVPYQGSSDYKTASQITALEKQGYELVSDNFPADGLHYQKEGQQPDFQVVLKHKDKTVDPNNPGQPGQPIDPNNPDGPKYPNGTDKSSLEKTITRAIDYVDGNGKQVAPSKTETVTYDRTATIDQVTGKVTYSDWTPKDGQTSFAGTPSPIIPGYYADQAQVPGKTVNPDDQDETVTVTYHAMGHLVPDVPGNNPVIYPNNPTNPSQPGNPVVPNIPGYTPTDGNSQPVKPGEQYPIDPKQPGKDTPIHYVKDLQAKVTYIDQNDGKTLHEDALTVPYQGSSDYKTADEIKTLTNQGYELVSDNFPADGLYYQKEGQQSEFQVVLKHKNKTVDPSNPGQPGQPIDPNNPDGPKYPNGTDKSSLEKTITRTIDYVDGNGKQIAPSKTERVTYNRTATIDQVTGKVTYSDWTAKDGQTSFAGTPSPVVSGYYADQAQVPGKMVNPADQDETVTVTYHAMGHLVPDVPGNNPVIYPNNPSDPTQPTNPVIPNIPGYTPTDGNGQPVKPGEQYPIDPKQPGKDMPIHYVKDLQAKVTYIDQNDGKTLHEDSLTVPYQGSSDYKTANQIASLEKQGYELVSDNFPADGLHYQKEGQQSDYQVVLKHKDKTVDPNNPGQPGQPIDPNNPDGPKYPNGTDKSSLEKTITRTIDYVDGNGKQLVPAKTETVTYDRTATIDQVTGQVTYSDWTPKDGQTTFAGAPSPVVPGYYADQAQVPGKTVNPSDQDETVTVTYQPMGHLVPDVPGQSPIIYPNNPVNPSQAGMPVIPNIPGYTPVDGNGHLLMPGAEYPIDPTQPGKDTTIHYVKNPSPVVPDQPSGQSGQAEPKSAPTQSEAGTLPNTGKRMDKNHSQASSLLGLTLSALGFGYVSRKKKD
ncbi:MucBP domain-containing protein [Leuconostocaceae bacterium ESL0958]|nr:MucBP domain-containing protein [Leuconostocaceae bacterium ESL0958]